ncbi:MAG: D-aminoacylase [Actinomyces sp.]|nr:MAG: D-aminoacylase [Actinomyces sp.]
MAEHELVIRAGRVVDGTGAPARTADVAVDGGLVTEVGRVSGRGRREVDADGALVIPGFVDIHSHYDGQATWDSELAPSSSHGVTTVVMGNCGVGFAPVHEHDHERLIELMEGVEDIPGAALHEGLSWEWSDFAAYLNALEARPHDIDLAAQVPHGALRLHVMGERGAAREAATPDDIAEMGRLAAEAVEAGALGFTTSRTRNHRTSRGEFTPTLTAEADELVGIAEAVGTTGRGVLQVVSDFVDLDAEFAMLRTMVERSGRPLSVSLAASPAASGHWRRILEHIEEAAADGLEMRAQVAPRPVGIILGLDCTLNPFMTTRVWRDLADRPLAEKVARLHRPETREALLAEMGEARAEGLLGGRLIGRFDLLFELDDPPDYEPDPASSLEARAARRGVGPAELALDILCADGGRGLLYLPFLNWVDGSLDAVGEMLAHPRTVPGLADGGAHVGTICDGSFPTTLLTLWGRDRERGRLPLEDLVRMQCHDTARAVGLEDRGVLAPGYRGDVVVIDFDHLTARRPYVVHDLPAGGRRLLQDAEGYLHTFVAGVEIRAGGEATGEYPGRLVRGPRPAPTGGAAPGTDAGAA